MLLRVATAPPPSVPRGTSATPIAGGNAAASGQAFAAGDVVITNDDANLRVLPSTDAQIAETVVKGTKLVILGASVEAEGFVWWPVSDPSTHAIGWIRAEFIARP
jgi:hypothetical protein